MNGTDPNNPSNLQPPVKSDGGGGGPYDAQRLEVAHAELIDLSRDTNSTLDALVAALMAKDIKVFILVGFSAFVEGILEAGLDRGIFGPAGYQFMMVDGVFPNTMNKRCRAVLDGAIEIMPASISTAYPGVQRASVYWGKHPPTLPPAGGDISRPFELDGRTPRFADAALYDSIILAATAIDACLKDGCRPVGQGYEDVMPYFRKASIDGVAGPTSIKAGSNDPQGRLFSLRVGVNPASSDTGLDGPYTFNEVAVTSTTTPEIEVCIEPDMGNKCEFRAAAPRKVTCFASSATSIDVAWEAAKLLPPLGYDKDQWGRLDFAVQLKIIRDAPASERGLLNGYRVTAFASGEQVIAVVNSTAETRVAFRIQAAGSDHIRSDQTHIHSADNSIYNNVLYGVQVEALYDNAMIRSKAATCQVPQNGLPCLPLGEDATVVGQRFVHSKGGADNCPCLESHQVYDRLRDTGYVDRNGDLSVMGTSQPLWPSDRDGQTYGGDSCASHDNYLPPPCGDDTGRPLAGAPSWCAKSWCYVDSSTCALATTASTYFPAAKLTYSYATCGDRDTFSAVCNCATNQFHTKGMPPAMDDPPLQPDGSIEAQAKDWQCEACMEGAQCFGGTASTLQAQPGWFVIRAMSKSTGAEKRPTLWRCPGGPRSCPGGASIVQVMGVAPTTSKNAATACKSTIHATNGLLLYPQCQCGPGSTGMLCQACNTAAIVGGKDWVAMRGSGCRECTIRRNDATSLVMASTAGFLLLVLCAGLGYWRYTRPSIMEQRFVNVFRHINEKGAERSVTNFFGVPIGLGITKDVFVAAVIRQCGRKHGGSDSGVAAKTEAHALKLWDKLDEDDDGQVTLDEFVTFVCDLREGKHAIRSKCGKASIAAFGHVLEWWCSIKSQTLRAVVITHFQLMSSLEISFPEMDVNLMDRRNAAKAKVVAAAEAASNRTASAPNGTLHFFKDALNDATGTVSNLNVAVMEHILCFVGPRHESQLVKTTVAALGLILTASFVSWAFRCVSRGKNIAQHDSNAIAHLRQNLLKVCA